MFPVPECALPAQPIEQVSGTQRRPLNTALPNDGGEISRSQPLQCGEPGHQPRDRDLAEYEFNPLGLVFRERIVYLVATLWNYTDPRQFAVHRFDQATVMDKNVTVPDGFEFDAYIATGAFEYPMAEVEPITLELRMSVAAAGHLYETPLSEDQILAEDPDDADWVRVTATQHQTERLYWWLLGFGAQVEVLEPMSLRERMVSNVLALAGQYGLNDYGPSDDRGD